MKKKILYTILMIVAVIPLNAYARVMSGEDVVISETLGENLYVAGESVTIDARVEGDVFVAAQSVRVNAPITGDLFVAAQSVAIQSEISGDVRGGVQTMSVHAPIIGEILVAAQTVSVENGASVGKHFFVAGDKVTVNAPVGGDVRSAAGRVRFGEAATVGGTIDLYNTPSGSVNTSTDDVRNKIQFHASAKKSQTQKSSTEALISFVLVLLFAVVVAALYPVLVVASMRQYVASG